MRLLIFGATGGTGRELVRQAVGHGHAVTAFVRDPAALDAGDDVRGLAGDVLDATAVQRAVADHDAVLCALGSSAMRPGRVRSDGTRNIVRAMKRSGAARLVCLSTIGVGDSREMLPRHYRHLIVPLLLRATFTEHDRQEQAVRASDLQWTIVRAGALTRGERTGNYRHGLAPSDRSTALEISRADVADFMLGELAENRYVRETSHVSY